jgi:hypothetical protein
MGILVPVENRQFVWRRYGARLYKVVNLAGLLDKFITDAHRSDYKESLLVRENKSVLAASQKMFSSSTY